MQDRPHVDAVAHRGANAEPNAPRDDGGPDEAARFLQGMIADLSQIARKHRYVMLSYLLDMAQLEVDEIVSSNKRR